MARRPPRHNRARAGFLRRLATDRRGATAIEYGLIIALLVLVMLAGLTKFADGTITMWGNVSAKVASAG